MCAHKSNDNQPAIGAAGLRITLGTTDGDVDAPEAVYRVTRRALSIVAEGKTPAVVIEEEDLTTQEAAAILNVSRPHVIKVLDEGEIPYYRVGTHRRIPVAGLLAYKRRRDETRREALQDITRISQELDLYE